MIGRLIRTSRKGRMRQREIVEFRTPEHPSLGTNHWGGASPLLARNIPNESLELKYLRPNTNRTRDEIYPPHHECYYVSKYEYATTPSRSSRSSKGFLSKLMFPWKKKVVLDLKPKKKRWFTRWDPLNRWPQGWC